MRHLYSTIFLLALLAAAAPVLAVGSHGEGSDRHGHSWEGFAERHDANGDGAVTREELELRHFERLDADGDGLLTEEDFAARHAQMAVALLARRADDDRDGAVTAAEWDAWFAAHDANSDGRLDETDREAMRERHRALRAERGEAGPRDGERRHRMHRRALRHHGAGHHALSLLDTDGDGAVVRSELDAFVAGFDADGDGVLAGDELPALRHRGHGPFGHRGPRGPRGGDGGEEG